MKHQGYFTLPMLDGVTFATPQSIYSVNIIRSATSSDDEYMTQDDEVGMDMDDFLSQEMFMNHGQTTLVDYPPFTGTLFGNQGLIEALSEVGTKVPN